MLDLHIFIVKGAMPFLFLCKLCLLISFWCVGMHKSTDEEEIFHWLYKLSARWPWYINKPIIHCVDCMASFHSLYITAAVFLLKDISFSLFLQTWVPAAMICTVLNGIVYLVWATLLSYFKKANQ